MSDVVYDHAAASITLLQWYLHFAKYALLMLSLSSYCHPTVISKIIC